MLAEATTLADAVGRLDDDPPLDLVISRWDHGQAPDGGANGAALLRAGAARRAEGKGTPPARARASPRRRGCQEQRNGGGAVHAVVTPARFAPRRR